MSGPHQRLLAATIAVVVGLAAAPGSAQASNLFFPQDTAMLTNSLYNHSCFWGGPRGMDYAVLPGAQPIQTPNLYPDKGSTYFVSQFTLPAGASLDIHGVYARERYFSFTAANQLPNGVVGNGDFVRDEQIDPDPGSVNPFRQSPNDRMVTGQTYTLHVKQGLVPADRSGDPSNTIYTGRTDQSGRVAMRNYVPDQGLTGTGGVDLPEVTVKLADGTMLTGDAMCQAVNAQKTATPTGFPQATYYNLVNASTDPVNAPAKPSPVFERFWNNQYSILGLFYDPLPRVQTFSARDDGGYATNPDTRYVATALSLGYGKVIVVRGKMPTYQHTRPSASNWTPGQTQVRYWSACTAQGPVSGKGSDCTYDQQVPLDQNGYYTIVVSRPEDRPANANTVCGVKWLDFGIGEGNYPPLSTVPNSGPRNWISTFYLRYMDSDPNWAQSPVRVPQPTTTDPANHVAETMGAYSPVAQYESQAQYEANGCDPPRLDAGSSTPSTGAFGLRWDAITNDLPQLHTLQHENAQGGWSDVASGFGANGYTFPSGTPEAEGTWTYRVGSIDIASSETTPSAGDFGPASDPVKVDQSAPNAPTASADRTADYAGGGGWFKDSVTVSFTDDGDPALADGSAGSGVDAATLTSPSTVTADGSTTVSGTVKDNVGNESAPGRRAVLVDATMPSVSVTCPAVLLLHATGSATTTASDGGSGLAVDPSGVTAIDTSTVGAKTTTRTAIDNVGHSVTRSCTTKVQYMYSGLLGIKPDGSSTFRRPLPVPVSFRLTDFAGLSVNGAVATLDVAKVTGGVVGSYQPAVSATGLAQGSRFLASPIFGLYGFDLKTSNLAVGVWSLRVTLDDGTQYSTRITLK